MGGPTGVATVQLTSNSATSSSGAVAFAGASGTTCGLVACVSCTLWLTCHCHVSCCSTIQNAITFDVQGNGDVTISANHVTTAVRAFLRLATLAQIADACFAARRGDCCQHRLGRRHQRLAHLWHARARDHRLAQGAPRATFNTVSHAMILLQVDQGGIVNNFGTIDLSAQGANNVPIAVYARLFLLCFQRSLVHCAVSMAPCI